MLFDNIYSIRQAEIEDCEEISTAINTFLTHQHLDWDTLLDQIQTKSVFLFYQNHHLTGILSLSGENPQNQWVKLFAVRNEYQKHLVWKKLLEYAFKHGKTPHFYTIAFWDWYRKMITNDSHFSFFEQIIVLQKQDRTKPYVKNNHSIMEISPINIDEFSNIQEIDQNAFEPPWQFSASTLNTAIQESKIRIAARSQEKIVGFLLADYEGFTAHLARVAVLPLYTRKGIASALIQEMFSILQGKVFAGITVNTQETNTASINLYRKFGFQLTGEKIPVFRYHLSAMETSI